MFEMYGYKQAKAKNEETRSILADLKVKRNSIDIEIENIENMGYSEKYLDDIFYHEFEITLQKLSKQNSLSLQDLKNLNEVAYDNKGVEVHFNSVENINLDDSVKLEITDKAISITSDSGSDTTSMRLKFNLTKEVIELSTNSLIKNSNYGEDCRDYTYSVIIESQQRDYFVIIDFRIPANTISALFTVGIIK